MATTLACAIEMTEKALFPQQITFKLGDDTIIEMVQKLPTAKALAMSWLKALRLAENMATPNIP